MGSSPPTKKADGAQAVQHDNLEHMQYKQPCFKDVFPAGRTPYPIQLGFMRSLYAALDLGGVALLESPTGQIYMVPLLISLRGSASYNSWLSSALFARLRARAHTCVCMYVCVCVCAHMSSECVRPLCACDRARVYVCVCVCVCV